MNALMIIRKTRYEALGKQMELLQKNLAEAVKFIRHIREGNWQAADDALDQESELTRSLKDLRGQMAEVYRQEQQRTWTNEGIARFAELLRMHQQEDSGLLFNKLISSLVTYLKANQGGIFIRVNENGNDVLKLVGCYAYQKRKYISRCIALDEGLVGQCFSERDVIYLTEVPENYIKITSGLGEALPRNILLVPLLTDKEVVGVIELASFEKLAAFQIDFVKKVSESIASAVIAMQVNERTQELLKESQLQATQLRSQEEEMRQNMEELTASQEEMRRLQLEIEAQTRIINSIAIVSKTDVRGNITYVNDEFVKWSQYSREELLGKNHRILKSGHQPDEIFATLWKTISGGRIWRGEVKNKCKDGSYYWVDAIIAPVLGADGKPKEYIAQRFVINEKKQDEEKMKALLVDSQAKEEELRQNLEEIQAQQEEMQRIHGEIEAQMKIINSVAIVSKTDVRGNITYVNDEFIKWSKYSREELLGKNHRMLKSGDQPDQIFVDLWRTISRGEIWRGKVKNRAKDGSFYWVDAIIAPVLDANGKPKEYIAQRFILEDVQQKKSAMVL